MARQSLASAFRNAAAGIATAARERNFRIELGFAVAAVVLGLWLGISAVEWAVVCALIGMVLGLECVNTALEAVVDLASPDINELARVGKDCAAGGVLVCSIASLFVAAFIFLPKMVALALPLLAG